MDKPRVGIFGLTGCAGDQLVILNCEDELLTLIGALDIRDFLMASSENDTGGELDLALVEGAVMSRRDEERLRQIRARSKALLALGTCAVWGGVAAGGDGKHAAMLAQVYGAAGAGYDSTPARALREVVPVDFNVTGCPIEKSEFLAAVAHLLNGNPPLPAAYPVCAECRMRENNCLLIQRGELCCGPLTQGGCAARCPALRVPCVGCRGPAEDANLPSALALFADNGAPRERVEARLRMFAPGGRS